MDKMESIYIAGIESAVGKEIYDKLISGGYPNVFADTYEELDLTRQSDVEDMFEQRNIEYMFLVAARSKGVVDCRHNPSANFMENTNIQNNVLSCCKRFQVKKTIYFSSVCALPDIDGTVSEDDMQSAKIASENEPYALAKFCGVKLCRYLNTELGGARFVSLLPDYIYGGVNKPSMILALFSDFHKAKIMNEKSVTLWGDPFKKLQLVHYSDVADAAIMLMNRETENDAYIVSGDTICTKLQLGKTIKKISGFTGDIIFDKTKCDSVSVSREVSNERIKSLGWFQRIELEDGLRMMYREFLKNPV